MRTQRPAIITSGEIRFERTHHPKELEGYCSICGGKAPEGKILDGVLLRTKVEDKSSQFYYFCASCVRAAAKAAGDLLK